MTKIYGWVSFSSEIRYSALGVGLAYITNVGMNDSSSMGTLMEKGQLEVANSFSVKRKREKKTNEIDIFRLEGVSSLLYPSQ